jgi:Peptidase A4 family
MLHWIEQPMAKQPASLHPFGLPTGLSTSKHAFDSVPSGNWSGIVADTSTTGCGVHAVIGQYNVASESGPVLGTWDGIGGYNNTSLIQTGVDQSRNETWYELLPAAPVYLYGVNNGDQIYSEIVSYTVPYTGLWYIYIADLTTGDYYVNLFNYDLSANSADWIEEQATAGNLPRVGTVNFTNAYWSSFTNPSQGRYIADVGDVYHSVFLNGTCGYLIPSAVSGLTFSISPSYTC